MIYIHIPFCERKCNYCAFNSKVGDVSEKNFYVDALIREINLRGNKSFVETIYFGGGTPTTLTPKQLEKIICAIRENFLIDTGAEITIEANPGTVDEDYLLGLKSLGFNRLSLGVQSFDDALLKILGRIHDSRTAIETIETATKIFDNVSVDLMYGLPNQTLEKLRRDLDVIKNLDVKHVSIYGLEIEEGTKFFDMGVTVDENLCADMYDLITETLPRMGWHRYEISNFARKNFESRHNIGYWTGKKYWGFGAGAHSFDGKLRTSNVHDVATYKKKICASENISVIEEIVTRQVAMEEFCFLGLRRTAGISAQVFSENFGADIFDVFGDVIDKNVRLGLLATDGDRIFLTERGMSLGNVVFADFIF